MARRATAEKLRAFLDGTHENARRDPLEVVGFQVRVAYKRFGADIFKPPTNTITVVTPAYSDQLKAAQERCSKNGHDTTDRAVLLSYVPAYLEYFDGPDGTHDLFYLARGNPGFLSKIYHDEVCDSSFPRPLPSDSDAGLVAFKSFVMV